MKLTDKLAVIEEIKGGIMDRCPHLIGKRAGDEAHYFCEFGGSCQGEYGLTGACEIWDEIQQEWKKDEGSRTQTDS